MSGEAVLQWQEKAVDAPALASAITSSRLSLACHKVTFTDDITFSNKVISTLEFDKCAFKGSVVFINCRFRQPLRIKGSRFSSNLSFVDCEFRGKKNVLFDTKISRALSLVQSEGVGVFSLENIKLHKLDVSRSAFKAIECSSDGLGASIEHVSLSRCVFSDRVSVININGLQTFNVSQCRMPELVLTNFSTHSECYWEIFESHIKYLSLTKGGFGERSNVVFAQSNFSQVYVVDIKLPQSRVGFERTFIANRLTIEKVTCPDAHIDIARSGAADVALDDELAYITLRHPKQSPLLGELHNYSQRIGTYRVLRKMFQNRHRFQEEDDCFFLMKNAKGQRKIAHANWLKKPFYWLEYMLGRYAFGWGVHMSNILVAWVLVMLAFSGFFYMHHELYDASNYASYADKEVYGYGAALMISVVRFFGQRSGIEYTVEPSITALLTETAIGVALIAIAAGMIIRKLVR